ncbi:MAG TPA: DNA repair and recombination protein RadA [Nitrososphaeraceae archaeon]|jgi:DNA repair protein RadA
MKKSNSIYKGILRVSQQEASAYVDPSLLQRVRLSTGSENLDDLLSGGLETGGITQIYGESNSGKSHLCHLICTVLPVPYQAIYVDTEGKFRIEKIEAMAKDRGLDWLATLANITVRQPVNCKQQETTIDEVYSIISSNPRIKLVVVDSMMFHYRAEYPGRSNLSERSHRLNIYMHKLHSLAQIRNIAVVITNYSTKDPHGDSKYKDPLPYGGSIISSVCTYIIYFARRSFDNIDANLMKSPIKGHSSHYLTIVDSGFLDPITQYLIPPDQ